MSALSKSLLVLLLFSVGFGAGWWARGPTLTEIASAPTQPAPQRPREPAQTEPDTASPPPSPARASGSVATPPAPEKSFAQLLGERQFNAAMNLFTEIERRDSTAAAELKSLVMQHLRAYLRDRDNIALTGLVDAYLSRYYNDLDVLLLLARYQLQAEYLAEAAHSYQLAFTYAIERADRQQVQRAFSSFVREVDELLAAQGRWRDLVNFYENLQLLDLSQPLHQLRQAELYIAQGDTLYAHDLLRRLVAEPAVAARAEALLAGTAPPAVKREPPQDSVALGVIGSHYHLPLRLNDRADVELIIDTGASTTTVSRQTFESIRHHRGFVELGPQVFNTANGVARGTVYRVERVQLGNHTLTDVQIAVLDFDMPPGIDGLLGMNVLSHFRFQVEQDEQRLYLRPRRG